VQWRGRGISEAWLEAMGDQGFVPTGNPHEADLAVFISDSQINRELLGTLPTICYFWGWQDERLLDPAFHQFANEKLQLMSRCTRVLVPSVVTYYQACHFGIPSQVCFPGVDTKVLNMGQASQAPQVLFISRLAPHKGLDMLIQAMSLISPRIPLKVIGPGDRQPYERLAQELQVPVTFLEATDEEKAVELKRSSVLVHPSWYEGLSLPPLEALYCGVPVIASDIPQHRHLLQEDAAYFTSVEGLAGAIVEVLQNPQAAAERTQRGQRRVRSSFTIQDAARRLWAHLHQVHKSHWAGVLRANPHDMELVRRCYEAEHRRNWAYGMSDADVAAPLRFDPGWARHWRAQHFIRVLREAGAENMADVGCGAVYPTIFAKAGFRVTGVDISQEALDQAAALAAKWGVRDRVLLFRAPAQHLPFDDGLLDAVVLGEILEHVPDPQNVLTEAMRVVKPGGVVVLSTPIGHEHYDPYHIASADGGWSDALMDSLLAPWRTEVRLREKIAEDGVTPSCYLVVLRKGKEYAINAQAKVVAVEPGI
jgi:2-polyprenyl-3-methyl-5-hydroxy-6-metoxy-1,4-benzoquinol methylase